MKTSKFFKTYLGTCYDIWWKPKKIAKARTRSRCEGCLADRSFGGYESFNATRSLALVSWSSGSRTIEASIEELKRGLDNSITVEEKV